MNRTRSIGRRRRAWAALTVPTSFQPVPTLNCHFPPAVSTPLTAIPDVLAAPASSRRMPRRAFAVKAADDFASSFTAAGRGWPALSTFGVVLPTATQARSVAMLYDPSPGAGVVLSLPPCGGPFDWSHALNDRLAKPWKSGFGTKRTRVFGRSARSRAFASETPVISIQVA